MQGTGSQGRGPGRRAISILFVCTGNIFRSVVAEHALKAALGSQSDWDVGSAGTEAVPQGMHPLIQRRLEEKGADVSRHVQRRLTRALLERIDLPVAMGRDHRAFIRRHFGLDVPLFEQICSGTEASVLDVHEAVPAWAIDVEGARAYAAWAIEHIWESMPRFLANMDGYLSRLDARPRGADPGGTIAAGEGSSLV